MMDPVCQSFGAIFSVSAVTTHRHSLSTLVSRTIIIVDFCLKNSYKFTQL